jgi:hypothetical protein
MAGDTYTETLSADYEKGREDIFHFPFDIRHLSSEKISLGNDKWGM